MLHLFTFLLYPPILTLSSVPSLFSLCIAPFLPLIPSSSPFFIILLLSLFSSVLIHIFFSCFSILFLLFLSYYLFSLVYSPFVTLLLSFLSSSLLSLVVLALSAALERSQEVKSRGSGSDLARGSHWLHGGPLPPPRLLQWSPPDSVRYLRIGQPGRAAGGHEGGGSVDDLKRVWMMTSEREEGHTLFHFLLFFLFPHDITDLTFS